MQYVESPEPKDLHFLKTNKGTDKYNNSEYVVI